MRHQVKGRHLGRTAEHRRALYRNLVTALFEHGRIRTTDAKAREVRPLAERLITLGKRGDLHARRQALRFVPDGPALQRLFGPIAERFADRPGGYTRLIKAGRRVGDAAPLAYLELLEEAPKVVRVPGAEGEEEEAPRRRSISAGKGRSRPKASAKGEAAEAAESGRKARREAKKASPKARGAGTPAQGERGRKSRRGEAHSEDI